MKSHNKLLYLFIIELFILGILGIWVMQKGTTLVRQTDDATSLSQFALPRGTYDVYIDFTSDNAQNAAAFITESNDAGFLADQLQCYPWRHSDMIQLWCPRDYEDLSFVSSMSGTQLTFDQISIYSTNSARRIVWLCALGLFSLISIVALWIHFIWKKSSNKRGTLIRTALLLGVALLACRPLLFHNLFYGDDQMYHLERIEGICSAITTGQFPVRISPYFLDGAGYAVSIFYGDATLYVAAFFHLMGIPLQTSYKLYILLVNLGSIGIAWFAFSRVFKNKWASTLASIVYVLSLYRFCDLYSRASVGEYTAMMFIPLVLCGFYIIFTKESYGKTPWIMIMTGMAAIIVTHNITSLMITIVIAIWCLFYLRRILKKKTLIPLLLTIVGTICFSAYYIVPFIDYMLFGNYFINSMPDTSNLIGDTGLTWQGILNLSIKGTSSKTFGALLLCFIVILAAIVIIRCIKLKSIAVYKHTLVILFMAVITLWATTIYFPWNYLAAHSSIMNALAGIIQFSFRFTAFATFFSAWCAGLIVEYSIGERRLILKRAIYVIAILSVFITAAFSLVQFVAGATPVKIYGKTGLQLYVGYDIYQGYMSADDFYLPVNSDIDLFKGMSITASSSDLQVSDYAKDGLTISVHCNNTSTQTKSITVPLLYYKGYQAFDTTTGQKFTVEPDEHDVVTVQIPAGTDTAITITFVEPWYWRVAEMISLLSLLVLLYVCIRKKEHKRLLPIMKSRTKETLC